MLKAIMSFTVEVDYSKLIESEEGLNALKKFLNVSDEKMVAKFYMDNFAKSVIEGHLKAEHINYNVTGDIVEVPEGEEGAEGAEEAQDVSDATEDSPSLEDVESPQNYEFNSEGLTIGGEDISSFLQEYIVEMDAKYGEPVKIYIAESNYNLLSEEYKEDKALSHIFGIVLEVVEDGMFNYAMDFKRHGKDLIDTHYIY